MGKSKIVSMSYSSNEHLDSFFNTSPSDTIVRLSKEDERQCVPLTNRGGSIGRYPWRDPSYKVGDSFFKPMSKEELEQDKGRPGQPPSVRDEGLIWRSKRIYHKGKKQYGYRVTRIR